MDHRPPKDEDFFVDLETGTCVIHSTEKGSPKQKLCGQLMSVDHNLVKLSVNALTVNNGCQENNVKVVIDLKEEGEKVGEFTGKKMGKENRKKPSSVKKPPKPPRPPRGFSLDASDQKLIKELAELAMMKRARIERMKKKALKASSSSSSSMSGSLFAMLFTVIFILMILLQGRSCRSPGVTSPQATQTNENGLVFIQEQLNPSAYDNVLPDSKSSNLSAKISGKVQ